MNVREKAEREMDLIGGGPAHAANSRIEIDQNGSNRFRGIDRHEKATEFHLARRISAPDFGSLPLWLTCDGSEALNILIMRAIKFGNSAFAAMMR